MYKHIGFIYLFAFRVYANESRPEHLLKSGSRHSMRASTGSRSCKHAGPSRKIHKTLQSMIATSVLTEPAAAGQSSQQHQLALKEAHEQALALGPLPGSGTR